MAVFPGNVQMALDAPDRSALYRSATYARLLPTTVNGVTVRTLAMPITGWWFSSSAVERRPLTWFGLFDIPYLPV